MDSFGNGGPLGKQEKDFATDDVVLQHTENTNDQMFSNVDEKKVLRKMDIRLIPMLALLYLLSFLDVSPLSLKNCEPSVIETFPHEQDRGMLILMLIAWKHWQCQNPRSH